MRFDGTGAPVVLGGGDRFQVIGADTAPHPTEVVDVQAVRDGADEKLEHEAVGQDRTATPRRQGAVAVCTDSADPLPATIPNENARADQVE